MAARDYQRTELPPGFSGQVKPTFDLADRSGQTRLAGVVGDLAGDKWSRIIRADASLETHEFQGMVLKEEAELDKKINANPGAPIEKYQEWKREMLANIKKAGGSARTGLGKQSIRNWYARNEKLLGKRADASFAAIETKREFERFKLKEAQYVERGEFDNLKNLYFGSGEQPGVSGNLFDTEQADLMFRQDAAELLEGVILRQALAMPEDEGQKHIENANKTANESYQVEGKLFSPDDIDRIKNRYNAQVKNARAQSTIQLEANKIEAENKYQEVIVRGDYPIDLAVQIETDPAFDAYPEASKGLINWMSQYSNAALSRKESPSEAELLDAHNEIYDADNSEKAKELLAKHAPMFKIAYGGSDHTITILKEIRKQETEGADPILKDGMDTLKRTRDTHLAALKKKGASLEDIAEKDISWSRRMNELRTTYRNNPDWGPKEKLDYQEQLTTAAKEEVSRDWLKALYILGPITGLAANLLFNKKGKPQYTKIATNPQTGEKVGWNGKEWEQLQ